jgi:hypothetical protein
VSATRPTPATPGAFLCPRCGSALARDQDWCLECGLAARTRVHPPPGWRLPIAATLLVTLLLAAGIALGLTAIFDKQHATPPAATVTAPATATTAVPSTTIPTVPTATTGASAVPGAGSTTTPATTVTPATVVPSTRTPGAPAPRTGTTAPRVLTLPGHVTVTVPSPGSRTP